MARHMFFGSNTPNGFYDGFKDILFPSEAKKIIYLKGSSGSGKSTMMKKVAAVFEEKGVAVDYIHCSNNVSDLDGICVRESGFAMVDATAPHVCDPIVPVAVDEIFNLADFINRDYIKQHAARLLELHQQKKPYYQKAYRYLHAAWEVYENSIGINGQALNQGKLMAAIEEEVKAFYAEPRAKGPGLNRNFFADAVSPQGRVSYLDSLIEGKEIIALKGEPGMGMDRMLAAIRDMAGSRGYGTESCRCVFEPEKVDHLLIPGRNLAYVTLNGHHRTELPVAREIDFTGFCDIEWRNGYIEELGYNQRIFAELLDKAMAMMDAQKAVHDEIERIYVAGMDFDGVDQAFEGIMEILR